MNAVIYCAPPAVDIPSLVSLRDAYGCAGVVDAWDPRDRILDGCLHLCRLDVERVQGAIGPMPGVRVVDGDAPHDDTAPQSLENGPQIDIGTYFPRFEWPILPEHQSFSQLWIEADPHGRDPHAGGVKLDAGKNQLGLVMCGFPQALLAIGQVATFGAAKYAAHGWRTVPDGQTRYTDAMYRHLLAEHAGESTDPETRLLHAAHAAWNALARLELLLQEPVQE